MNCKEKTQNLSIPCQDFSCMFNLFWDKLELKKPNYELGSLFYNCEKILFCIYPRLTLEMIGEIWGLSRERIRQLEDRALRKLKASFEYLEEEGLIQPRSHEASLNRRQTLFLNAQLAEKMWTWKLTIVD